MFEEIFINQVYCFDSAILDPFIIDCGANIGISVIFFKMLYPNSHILAFEPDLVNFRQLRRNIGENNLTNIDVLNRAVWNHEGIVNLYFNPKNIYSFSKSLITERTGKNRFKKVQSTLLSSYIMRKVDFLKMDIEGAEYGVIEDLARKRKMSFLKQGVFEIHHHLEPKKDQLGFILRILEENRFGYQIYSHLKSPFSRGQFQDVLIYIYKK